MTDQTHDLQTGYVELTADLVAAYVSNNSVPISALPELLGSVHAAISGLATGDLPRPKWTRSTRRRRLRSRSRSRQTTSSASKTASPTRHCAGI